MWLLIKWKYVKQNKLRTIDAIKYQCNIASQSRHYFLVCVCVRECMRVCFVSECVCVIDCSGCAGLWCHLSGTEWNAGAFTLRGRRKADPAAQHTQSLPPVCHSSVCLHLLTALLSSVSMKTIEENNNSTPFSSSRCLNWVGHTSQDFKWESSLLNNN